MREVMRFFPGDMFSRGLASLTALSAVNADAARESENITQPHGDMLRRRAELYRPIGEHFDRWGLVYALAALVVLSVSNIRLGVAAAFLCVYFGAYPGLLYEFRHFFHLAFVPYWACGYLIATFFSLVCRVAQKILAQDVDALRSMFRLWRPAVGIAFVVGLIAALGAAVIALRIVQQRRMDGLLIHYANAVLTPVETVWGKHGDVLTLCPAESLPGLEATATLPPFESAGEYLALSLKHTGYPLHLRISYAERPMVDFSQWCTPQPGLTGKSGNYMFFFPVYELVWPGGDIPVRGKFTGLQIPERQRHAVKGLYRVKNSDEFSLWPFLALPKHKKAFLTSKTGPFERFFVSAWVELRSFFGWNRRAALKGYCNLIRLYPGYSPFEKRAMEHVRNCKEPHEALELWALLLENFPRLYMEAAADMDVLMRQLEVQPGDASQIIPRDPWSLTRRGLQLQERGYLDEAAELYRAALNEAPDLMFAAENLDNYLRLRKTQEERVRTWKDFRERHPGAGLPLLFYGAALRAAEQFGAAAACFEEILETNPAWREDARLHLAGTEIMRGRRDEGVDMLLEIATAHPEKKKSAAAVCVEAARYLMEQGAHESAADLFGEACSLAPDDLWACVARGDAFAAAGEIEMAERTYFDVLVKAPESPYTAHQLDTLYEDMEKRLAVWRKLHSLHPEAAIPWLYLGRALEASGETAAALEAYQRALTRDPTLEDARNGVNRLAESHVRERQ